MAVLLLAAPALASWTAAGSGSAAGMTDVMPAGASPTAGASGDVATVTWAAVTLAGGTPVAGYVIARYNAAGAPQTVGGTCAGVVTTTTCTERVVGSGPWTYTDTPVVAAWTGAESPRATPSPPSRKAQTGAGRVIAPGRRGWPKRSKARGYCRQIGTPGWGGSTWWRWR